MNALRGLLSKMAFELSVRTQLLTWFGWKRTKKLMLLRNKADKDARVPLPQSSTEVTLRHSSSDWKVFMQIFGNQEYAPIFPIDKVTRIADFGANIGLTSIFFSRLYSKAEIHAVEPEKNNFLLAEKNCAPFPQIHVHCGAVWSKSGYFTIKTAGLESWAFKLGTPIEVSDSENTVQARTVGDWLQLWNWDYVDILKLDVEGAEREIFSNHSDWKKWIHEVRVLLIETHDETHPGCMKALTEALYGLDFRWVMRGQTHQIYFRNQND